MSKPRVSFTAEERDLAVEACRIGLVKLRRFLAMDYQVISDGLLAKLEHLPLARPQRDGAVPGRKRRQERVVASPATDAPIDAAVHARDPLDTTADLRKSG